MPLRRMTMLVVALIEATCVAARLCAASTAEATFAVHSIALPGAPSGGVFMDYLAYDRAHHRVWVPAGNTGNVYAIDVTTDQVATVTGFATAEVERHGAKRVVGPSSATVGDGVVYVGNRGDSSVCAVGAESLRIGRCLKLDSMPDGLAYVPSTKEVWATTPHDKSIAVIDAAGETMTLKGKIALGGAPEGFAVDNARRVFYTNLEDGNRTLAIAIDTRKVKATWALGCGENGPRGLALDSGSNLLLVACTDRVVVLDAGRKGKQLSMIETGEGVDNIDYVESRREVYVAAARAAKLTIARIGAGRQLEMEAVVATVAGARNAVATDEGKAYLTDSAGGKLVVVGPPGPGSP